jgi:hypothetical protein
LETLQGNPSIRVELHTLDLESDALLYVSFRNHGADAEPPASVDHPMPRDARVRAQCVQRIPHLAGMPREAGELGYLPVGGDAPGGDAANNRVDALVSASHRLIVCRLELAILSACPWTPSLRIWSMQEARSERRMKPKSFDMKLLKSLQARGSGNSVQSAQEANECSAQQERTLHHFAFSFSRQPGHLPRRYEPHAPQ